MEVSQRFSQLITNIALTDDQRTDGKTKHHGVRKCLNSHYYSLSSETANSQLIGSWGKSTEVRPPRDVDILFVLPDSVFMRFQERTGNKQSQLLQEVKQVLEATYPLTKMRADGQVVVVPFSSYAVEVVPAFTTTTDQFLICDTNSGGKYRLTDPKAEKGNIADSNATTSGNTRDLIRMMKRWQEHCNVSVRSFWIELLVVDFLQHWEHRGKSTVYYDWMTRDFFQRLCTRAFATIYVPGTGEAINIGDAWKSKAESAASRAVKACELEAEKIYPYLAGAEWQKIFGDAIPAG